MVKLGMFSNRNENKKVSFLSETCQIEGRITSTGELTIAGIVDGNILSQELIILDTGTIKGDVKAARIEVEGQITGNIEGNNIFLGKNAVIRGSITFFESLKTEEGADVDGYIKKSKQVYSKDSKSEKEVTKTKFKKPTLVKDTEKEAV